jgi:Carboxypeptidase regulatory-like domain
MLRCKPPSAPPMSDVARIRIKRGPIAVQWAAAALLVFASLLTGTAGAQTAPQQHRSPPGPTGKLAGQVLGEDGKPAAKARVYCQSSDGRSPRVTKTDAQGHFQLTCPAGPVDVRARGAENWSDWMRNVRVRTGETTSITIHITPSPESGQEKKDKPETPQE